MLLGLALAGVVVLLLVRGDDDRATEGGPKRTGPLIGVIANSQDTVTAAEQDAARALGVQALREEIRWPEVEPRRGRFDDRRYDRLTAAAARRGLQILPLLFKVPRWESAHDTQLPPSLPRWQRFVRHVVGRYGPGGAFWREHPRLDGSLAMTTWEVWNEPYLVPFSYGGVDVARYARLVRATVQAGREVNPRVGFLAAVEDSYDPGDGSRRNWAEDLFAAAPDLGPLLGGVAVHPYTPGSPLSRRRDELRFSRIEDLLGVARRNHVDASRPLWITELGWSTCPRHPPCVSVGEQAAYWSQALARIGRPPLEAAVAAVFAYDLRNLGRSGPGDPQGDFGLITGSGARKPAWAVVHRAALAAR